MTMQIVVIVPTLGRALTTYRTIDRLSKQLRKPDWVIVVAVSEDDVRGVRDASIGPQIEFSSQGLCVQRNRALALAEGQADLIAFFDDDFLPAADYLARAEELLTTQPDIAGVTGRIIADGVRGPGISFDEAVAILDADAAAERRPAPLTKMHSLYGCNMVFRASALEGVRFDENLPLYGWQEDIDFSFRAGARGRLVTSSLLSGVHMGEKAGRTPGYRLGYSQMANPIYLLRKRTMSVALAARIMVGNLASNVLRSVRPEPYVDRRGRLRGNLIALGDLVRGRLDPRRILELGPR